MKRQIYLVQNSGGVSLEVVGGPFAPDAVTEIEEAIISALYDAFYAKQELATTHVFAALSQTVPLARTMAEKVAEQRNWAIGRARSASAARSA